MLGSQGKELVRSAGQGGVEEPLPPGPVLSQRDQALCALKALVEVLGPVGSQVVGLVEGSLLPHMRRWWPPS